MRFYLIDQLLSIFLLLVIIIIQQMLLIFLTDISSVASRMDNDISYGDEILRLIMNGEVQRLEENGKINCNSSFNYIVIVLLKNESYLILYLKKK